MRFERQGAGGAQQLDIDQSGRVFTVLASSVGYMWPGREPYIALFNSVLYVLFFRPCMRPHSCQTIANRIRVGDSERVQAAFCFGMLSIGVG